MQVFPALRVRTHLFMQLLLAQHRTHVVGQLDVQRVLLALLCCIQSRLQDDITCINSTVTDAHQHGDGCTSIKQLKLSADSSWPCHSEIHMQQQQQLRVMLIKPNQW